MNFVDKRNLFCNQYNALELLEYQKELKLIKRLINISEKAVKLQAPKSKWTREDICHYIAVTIVDYSKMAYDNVLLGHFHAANMVIRSILENLVCLDIILNDTKCELWKYYWVYSEHQRIYKNKRKPTQRELDSLQELYEDLGISKDFYTKQGTSKAYIEMSYGWTYKINQKKQFTFEKICDLVGRKVDYHGFSLMSDYSHGTSFYIKIHNSICVEEMMYMFINLYINLYQMVTMYCWDKVDEKFDDVTDELEYIFYRFIEYEEKYVFKTKN